MYSFSFEWETPRIRICQMCGFYERVRVQAQKKKTKKEEERRRRSDGHHGFLLGPLSVVLGLILFLLLLAAMGGAAPSHGSHSVSPEPQKHTYLSILLTQVSSSFPTPFLLPISSFLYQSLTSV